MHDSKQYKGKPLTNLYGLMKNLIYIFIAEQYCPSPLKIQQKLYLYLIKIGSFFKTFISKFSLMLDEKLKSQLFIF